MNPRNVDQVAEGHHHHDEEDLFPVDFVLHFDLEHLEEPQSIS
jgi:hypothetical protein